jgi:chromosome segregation ATPase
MTEDIGSDSHRRPSQPEIKMAVMEERLKEARSRDATIMTQLDILIGKCSKMETSLAVGDQRFQRLEAKHDDTTEAIKAITGRVDAIEQDKRSVTAIIMATISSIAAGATAWFK